MLDDPEMLKPFFFATHSTATGLPEIGTVTTNGTYYYGIVGTRIAFRQ